MEYHRALINNTIGLYWDDIDTWETLLELFLDTIHLSATIRF